MALRKYYDDIEVSRISDHCYYEAMPLHDAHELMDTSMELLKKGDLYILPFLSIAQHRLDDVREGMKEANGLPNIEDINTVEALIKDVSNIRSDLTEAASRKEYPDVYDKVTKVAEITRELLFTSLVKCECGPNFTPKHE